MSCAVGQCVAPAPPALQALAADEQLQLSSIWGVPWAGGSGASSSGQAGGASAGADSAAGEFTTWKFRPAGSSLAACSSLDESSAAGSGGGLTERKRIIDHIFFSAAQLAPTSRWRMLSEGEIGCGGLPCEAYPSDHVAVMVQLAWVAGR